MSDAELPYEISPDARFEQVGHELVIMDLATADFYQLNPVGAFIWSKLMVGLGESEIVRHITAQFEVSETEARSDLSAYCDALLDRGLITKQA